MYYCTIRTDIAKVTVCTSGQFLVRIHGTPHRPTSFCPPIDRNTAPTSIQALSIMGLNIKLSALSLATLCYIYIRPP